MRLKLTVHAQERIGERLVHIDHIKAAIKEPDSKKELNEGGWKVKKKIDDKVVVVVYSREQFRDKKEEYLIITTYYL